MTIAVDIIGPTTTAGKTLAVVGTKRPKREYAWDDTLGTNENVLAAAKRYACELLAEDGYPLDEPVFTEQYQDTRTGTLVAFKW